MSHLQNFKFEILGSESGPKVVFLHGLMGTGANWRKITSQLKQTFHILVYDQRGHGWSFKPVAGYTPEDYAEDLRLILDELQWRKVHLVGHSMGGRNALKFAQKYPQYLESLVIEDIGPEGNRQAMDKTLRLLDLVPTPFPDKASAKKFFDEDFPKLTKNHPQKAILGAYLYTNIEEKSDGTADWRFFKDGIIQSLRQGHFQTRWDEVTSLRMPTLWIRGGNSEDLSRKEFEEILKENAMIRGREIQDAGHWVHFDQPKAFINALQEFWRSL